MLVLKNLPANAGDKRLGLDSWIGKIPWRSTRQPTPVFLPGESHEQRRLVGLQSTGSKRVGHSCSDLAHTHVDMLDDVLFLNVRH